MKRKYLTLVAPARSRPSDPFLQPGTDSISAEKEGFRLVRQDNIKLDVGQNRAVNLRVELGAVNQEILVKAASPALDVSASAMGQVVENGRIIDPPLNGRDVFSLANLSPGVNPTGGSLSPGLAGGRSNANEVLIDGSTASSAYHVGVSSVPYSPLFAGFEATQPRSRAVSSATVPTDQWRQGDFSGLRNASGAPITICDPLTVRQDPTNPLKYIRTPFSGNRIPQDRIDPVAKNWLGYYPQPNATPVNPCANTRNCASSRVAPTDIYKMDTRFDHNFSEMRRMFVRASLMRQADNTFNAFKNMATSIGGTEAMVHQSGLAMDHTVAWSPTLLMDIGGVTSLGSTGSTYVRWAGMTHAANASLTKILPQHTIKTGFEYRKYLHNLYQPNNPVGTYSFNPGWTQQEVNTSSLTAGFGLASFLLGLPGGGSISHDAFSSTASSYYGVYVQDDWRVTHSCPRQLWL